MNNLIRLNLNIGGRVYPVKILNQDEESVRQIVKMLNDKIVEFRAIYAGKDMQDYLSMVLLWFVTESTKNNNSRLFEKLNNDDLSNMNDQLNKILEMDKL